MWATLLGGAIANIVLSIQTQKGIDTLKAQQNTILAQQAAQAAVLAQITPS
jgi:hypothetical protein